MIEILLFALIVVILILLVYYKSCQLFKKESLEIGGKSYNLDEILKKNKCPPRIDVEYVQPEDSQKLEVAEAGSKINDNERDFGTVDKRRLYPTMDNLVLYNMYSIPSYMLGSLELDPLFKISIEDSIESNSSIKDSTVNEITREYGTTEQRQVFPTVTNLQKYGVSSVPTKFISKQRSVDLFDMSKMIDEQIKEFNMEQERDEKNKIL